MTSQYRNGLEYKTHVWMHLICFVATMFPSSEEALQENDAQLVTGKQKKNKKKQTLANINVNAGRKYIYVCVCVCRLI